VIAFVRRLPTSCPRRVLGSGSGRSRDRAQYDRVIIGVDFHPEFPQNGVGGYRHWRTCAWFVGNIHEIMPRCRERVGRRVRPSPRRCAERGRIQFHEQPIGRLRWRRKQNIVSVSGTQKLAYYAAAHCARFNQPWLFRAPVLCDLN